MQGTALPAGDLRLAVRPAGLPARAERPQGLAGLPRRVPGSPGAAAGAAGVRRPDDGRQDPARRNRARQPRARQPRARDCPARHGRAGRGDRPCPAAGPRRIRRAVRRIRQPGQRAQVPGPDRERRPGRRCAPMKILATFNIKGGVGKTSTAVNLGYLAAQDGLRVLLWDLDPQAAASYLFRIRPRVKGGGKALIRGSREIDDSIKGTDFAHLDLLPADFTYRNLDLVLGATKKPTRRIARLLAPLSDQY